MAIKTKRMSDWLAQNGEAITAASKASMLKAVNDEVAQLQDGVFIVIHPANEASEGTDPQAIRPSDWINKKDTEVAEGVLVVEGGKSIVVATNTVKLPFASGNSYIGEPVINSHTDWEGKDNTTKIIAASKDGAITNTEAYAAGFCNKYSKTNKNGKGLTAGSWWLPSVAELMMIYANKAKINHALSLIDGADLISDGVYWASSISGINFSYVTHMNSLRVYPYGMKTQIQQVLPVSTFK